ncbi:hypothetical protein M4D58_23790 [Brevibacillus borstelensis]|uniref:hypothetical protein n=1 Tax=Brevibacillus borstelensis TaxID=45462 RepID=UPI00203C663B|nr:hypothetical protein [Brevibacillus borstelensis]MCM3593648.1 hypothetical protein [Brevibacillus borstelensis]
MFGVKKTQKPTAQTRDRVIVFDEDNKTCEILPVESVDEEVVRTADKTIPRADLELRLSKNGRVFVLNAPSRIVELTQHLARVERNTIIRQIAQYKRPFEEESKMDWQKIALLAALVIVAIVAAAK